MILFPINYCILAWSEFDILPSVVIYETDSRKEDDFRQALTLVEERFNEFDKIDAIKLTK